MDPLPQFRFHPDPIGTGSVVPSGVRCQMCSHARGCIYAGPVYSRHGPDPMVCPWCIADGTAAAKWDAEFTGAYGWADVVPEEAAAEVLTRTPGFLGWQDEHWMAHCGDPAVFLGPVGALELSVLPEEATEPFRAEALSWGWSTERADGYLRSLDRVGSPTGYLFKCFRCGVYLGYSDFH